MNTKRSIFRNQAGLVRTAIPGYRILRRVVGLQRARPAEPQTFPLAAE